MSVSAINGSSGYGVSQMAQNMFSETDADSDGSITLQELTTGASAHGIKDSSKAEALFKQIDADSDGRITKSELETDMKKNKPDAQMTEMKSMAGDLSAEDIKSMFDKMQQAGGGKGPSAGEMAQKLIEEADSDSDGVLTQEELTANLTAHGIDSSQAEEMFSTIDTDGDGSLTAAELTADAEKMQVQGPPPPPPPAGESSDSSDSSGSSSGSSSAAVSTLSDEDREKLQTLMDMMKQVLNQNGGNTSALKGMILDTSR